jgi:Tol biopolymer transport system component
MAADGSDLVNVTDNDAFNAMPVWSPDGTRIAFEATYGLGLRTDIYVMSPDGTGVQRLTATRGRSETDPAWSPDGTLIAFTVNRAKGGTIDTVDVATGAITEVVRGYDPAWSPDGLHIAFTSFHTAGDIFVVDADGSNRRRLTDDADVDKAPHWQPIP